MPGFQSSVNAAFAIGIPGEPYRDGPMVADTAVLESSGTPNIIGATAYTIVSAGVGLGAVKTVAAGGTALFAGILANPKSYATNGTTAGALNPTMTLPDGTQGELITEAPAGLFVTLTLTGAAAVGDNVTYNTTTGALSSSAAGVVVPNGYALVPGAIIDQFPVAATGLAVIKLTGQVVQTV